MILVGMLLGMCVAVPSVLLDRGYLADDYFQLALITQTPGVANHLFDLFRLSGGNAAVIKKLQNTGPTPWFTHPQLKISFWRPLSALLEVLDYRLFGISALAEKLHSTIWYLALVGIVGVLLRRVLKPATALLAIVVFALDPVHRQPTTWVASRNALVSAALGAAALLAYVNWRQSRRGSTRLLSWVFYFFALLGGEGALGILAYLLAYEFFDGKGRYRVRLFAVAPLLLLSAAWLAMYYGLGYGTHGSGNYQSPLTEPAGFVRVLPARILGMLGVQILGLPAELWFSLGQPELRGYLLWGGAVSIVLLLILTPLIWQKQDAAQKSGILWLSAGAAGTMILQSAGELGGRSFTLSSIGSSVIVAVLLQGCWPPSISQMWVRPLRLLQDPTLVILALAHLVVAPFQWIYFSNVLGQTSEWMNAAVKSLHLDEENVSRERLVFVQLPLPFLFMFVPSARQLDNAPVPLSYWVLSFAQRSHRIVRTGRDSLEVDVIDGRMLDTPSEGIFRSADYPLRTGDRIVLDNLKVKILADESGRPTRVEFTFDKPVDDPSIRLVAWQSRTGFQFIRPPPVGMSLTLLW